MVITKPQADYRAPIWCGKWLKETGPLTTGIKIIAAMRQKKYI
jgi:hypothetical protein